MAQSAVLPPSETSTILGAEPACARGVLSRVRLDCIVMMSPIAIAILSVSMSADAFAAAIGRGAQQRPNMVQALKAGLIFGVIEAITPLIGFGIGLLAAGLIDKIDHWIAFGLLGAVGAKMIWDALTRDDEDEDAAPSATKAGLIALVATAVGTSIDAGAVGVGLALLGANIWLIAACIGFTTFVLATLGLVLGRYIGSKLGRIVELVGGFALIVLGLKILLEHLGVLAS